MKQVQIIRGNEDNNKVTDIIIDGKPARRGFVRAWNDAENSPCWKLYQNDMLATNPFSEVSIMLNPIQYTIYAFCLAWYRRYERGIINPSIQTYDNMRYLFMEIDSNAYYDLLD